MFSAIADPSLGALAATATAFCWAVGALFFTSASRRIGQFKVNQIRLVMAIVLLVAACAFTGAFGALPLGQAALLALSGFAGLTLGDAAYFFALQTIGPRRGALVLSLHPIFAAWLGFWLLGEAMTWVGVCGMALTLVGVAWVVLERAQAGELRGSLWLGILGGVGGAVGQAVGAVLARAGLGHAPGSLLDQWFHFTDVPRVEVHALFGTLIRMGAGFVPLMLFAAARGAVPATLAALRDKRAMGATFGGSFFGPFLGVSLSLYALTKVDSYVASTLFATAPVLVIPLVWIIYGERISLRAVLGALVACAGVAVLTLREEIARRL